MNGVERTRPRVAKEIAFADDRPDVSLEDRAGGSIGSRIDDVRVRRSAGQRGPRRQRFYARQGLESLVAQLDRRMSADLTVSDHTLYVSLGDETLTWVLEERRLGG